MDYIRQLRGFYSNLNFNKLSTKAMVLYQAILNIADGANWIKELSIANITIMSICNLSIKELQNARNELITKNYIAYKKGRNQNEAPKYYIPTLYKESQEKKRQATGQPVGQAMGQPQRQPEGMAMGYINTLHYNTTLDLFFNYINNSTQDFFENGKDKINLQDKAIIVMQLKRLGIYVEDVAILELFTEENLMRTKIFYWAIKELYFSAYKVMLNTLTYNDLCLRYLKSKEYVSSSEGVDAERLIAYFIKCLQTELRERGTKNGKWYS